MSYGEKLKLKWKIFKLQEHNNNLTRQLAKIENKNRVLRDEIEELKEENHKLRIISTAVELDLIKDELKKCS